MKAAVLKEPGKIKVQEVPEPEIEEDEVLLKVKACSICGTDRKIYQHGRDQITGEQILGHEIAGEIIKTGSRVKYYQTGMRVTLAPNIGCGYCHICRKGWQQLCPDFKAFGIGIPGGFAEYLKVPAPAIRRGNMVEIPDSLSYQEGALLEPLACCVNARQAINIQPGENLLVFGAGIMGNFHLTLNRALGVSKIVMVDIDDYRLSLSREYGADYLINSRESEMKAETDKITNGRGMNNIITAVPVAEVQKEALDLLDVTGSINFFAGIAGEQKIPVSTNQLHYQQQTLTGTTGSSVRQFRQAAKIASSRSIDLAKLITKKIELKELESIFEKPEVIKKNLKIQVQFP